MSKNINKLKNPSKEELIQKWKKLFGTNSPQHAKKDLLIKHIAWELQAKQQGGLSAHSKKKLEKLASDLAKYKDLSEKTLKPQSNLEIKVGTKLIREYQGRKHEVVALEKGFEYKEKTYRSLSAIANEITGTRWNGKVFFGVKK